MPNRRPGDQTYAEVVSEAVNHFSTSGYTSPEELEYWNNRIRAAAERELIPAQILNDTLRSVLTQTYKRLIDDGGIFKTAPGIERFTIDRLRPELRAELDKRIVSSAQLIRLNREKAIEDTLRRFQGWATSIPKSGEANPEKRKTTQDIKKSMKSLPFAERRVLIDQGHKLTAAISDVVATGGGAIAAIWRSHWKQPGYDYRSNHKERDGHVYLIKNSWAHKDGLVKPGKDGFTADITQPGEEVFCLPGDSKIQFADDVVVAYQRPFTGDIAVIRSSSGNIIRLTMNHPVLTRSGWKAAGLVNEGDELVEVVFPMSTTKENDQDCVPTIAEVFSTAKESGFPIHSRSGAEHDFHGDGSDSQVDIVNVAGRLMVDHVTEFSKPGSKFVFTETSEPTFGISSFSGFIMRSLGATSSLMRRSRDTLPTFWTHVAHSYDVGCRSISEFYTSIFNLIHHHVSTDVVGFPDTVGAFSSNVPSSHVSNLFTSESNLCGMFGDDNPTLLNPKKESNISNIEDVSNFPESFPFAVKFADVVNVDKHFFTGHVYNLQTKTEWYVAEGIVTHNCRCRYTYVFSLRDLPADMLTKKGATVLQEAKAQVAVMMATT